VHLFLSGDGAGGRAVGRARRSRPAVRSGADPRL